MANIIRKYSKLAKKERIELVNIYSFFLKVRIRLWITSYSKTRKWCVEQMKHHHAQKLERDSLLRLINMASRFVPKATCLTKALVANFYLTQHGYSNRLIIGVKKAAPIAVPVKRSESFQTARPIRLQWKGADKNSPAKNMF